MYKCNMIRRISIACACFMWHTKEKKCREQCDRGFRNREQAAVDGNSAQKGATNGIGRFSDCEER